ncbi:MAG: hypothetical protein L6Q54_05420 [Leptospiraceae bacterium]|nr:hypothetical protein [Leptospiraceae bacterium]MCK6380677.1 hypothetical protein [Leptospiraceae bacterium]NUM42081.1 hypothetical protein [Leptospiraceae bacterium]
MKKLYVMIFCVSIGSFAQDRGDEYIAWTKIPDANGYVVEIRNESKEIVLQKKVTTSFLEVNLQKGKYEVRTAPLDIFGKPAVWSNWEIIKVIVSIPPVVSGKQPPVKLQTGKKNPDIKIEGKNFLDNIQVYAKNNLEKIPSKSVKVSEGGNSVSFSLDTKEAKPGTYDLVLANPRKKNIEIKDFVVIGESLDEYSWKEYLAYLNGLKKSCPGSETPDYLVQDCFQEYIYVDFSNKEKEIAFQFLKAVGNNYNDRFSAYNYFAKNCHFAFKPIIGYLEYKLNSSDLSTDSIEISAMKRTLNTLKNCTGKNSL